MKIIAHQGKLFFLEQIYWALVKMILQKRTFRGHSKSAFLAIGGGGKFLKCKIYLISLVDFSN